MKIGFFDSGLGGLMIMKSCMDILPDYDYVYLGDTLHVPYGGRSKEAIYAFSIAAVEELFKRDCQIVIMACNTASAVILRKLQQEWLKENYPDRRVLGVVVPTLEAASEKGHKKIGLIATAGTVESDVYRAELNKIDPDMVITSQPCPLLVPLIEYGRREWVGPILGDYLQPLITANVESLILGCTHYPLLKGEILAQLYGTGTELISQDEIIPHKLKDYLERHSDMAEKLSKKSSQQFLVTDLTPTYSATAERIFGTPLHLEKVTV